MLDAAVANPDPAGANRDITSAHHQLSLLLDRRLGPDAGANFHTWAVWGSREAGTTIGQDDVSGLTARVAVLVGAGIAVLGAAVAGWRGAASGALMGVAAGAAVVRGVLNRARGHVAHGNRIVVDEIGGVTARFVTAFANDTEADPDRLSSFLDCLRPGPTAAGGQDELARAFIAYHRAAFEPDVERKHQLVFAGNCRIVAHEHIRLQRDIATAMPRTLRRWITRTLLDSASGPKRCTSPAISRRSTAPPTRRRCLPSPSQKPKRSSPPSGTVTDPRARWLGVGPRTGLATRSA